MPIKVTCSNCGGVLHAPDDAGGKRGRCPTCGNILPIPAAGGGSDLPDPPAPAAGQRPPSFADFALGPQVGPPPGGSGEAARASVGARASIPFAPDTSSPAAPQRAKAPVEPADTRRPADPFTRKGTAKTSPTATQPATEGVVNGWKRSRGGLGWVQAANFLLFIPVVLLPAYFTADAVMKAISTAEVKDDLIPYKNPGFLGLGGIDTRAELALLAGGVPVLLALLMHLLGRLGFAGAPKRAAVGGPAMLSALATLWVVVCVVAVALPSVLLVFNPQVPENQRVIGLLTWDSYEGMIQRLALFSGLAAVVVGEFWFASAVGRVGSALADGKPAARSTRFLMLLGVVVIGLVGTGAVGPGPYFGLGAPSYADRAANQEFPVYHGRTPLVENAVHQTERETNWLVAGQWEKHVGPQFDLAGVYKPVIAPALFLLFGFIVWVMYVRLVGAARGAMAGWLDAHGGA